MNNYSLECIFIQYSAEKLKQLTARIAICIKKLDDEKIWARGGENENAAGNLLLHLTGNVRQWIVSGVGGAPDIRERDLEFSARGGTGAAELVAGLETVVDEAVRVIETLDARRLMERVKIQKYELTVLEAVYHVVEHFSQHTGQIVLLTKIATQEDLGFYRHLKAAAHAETTP
jgi:uncharacterized damage-inducible protein DinB